MTSQQLRSMKPEEVRSKLNEIASYDRKVTAELVEYVAETIRRKSYRNRRRNRSPHHRRRRSRSPPGRRNPAGCCPYRGRCGRYPSRRRRARDRPWIKPRHLRSSNRSRHDCALSRNAMRDPKMSRSDTAGLVAEMTDATATKSPKTGKK